MSNNQTAKDLIRQQIDGWRGEFNEVMGFIGTAHNIRHQANYALMAEALRLKGCINDLTELLLTLTEGEHLTEKSSHGRSIMMDESMVARAGELSKSMQASLSDLEAGVAAKE